MITIACVYKIGKDFKPEHVFRLKKAVANNVSIPYQFRCLTDCTQTQELLGFEAVPLTDKLDGWWSKLELFKNFDNCFYLDLDTSIIGNLDAILNRGTRFKILKHGKNLGSGLMHWKGDYSCIYRNFIEKRDFYQKTCTTIQDNRWGDQGYLQHFVFGVKFDKLNSVPNEIISYKINNVVQLGIPNNCKIVYFHGTPRPWEVHL